MKKFQIYLQCLKVCEYVEKLNVVFILVKKKTRLFIISASNMIDYLAHCISELEPEAYWSPGQGFQWEVKNKSFITNNNMSSTLRVVMAAGSILYSSFIAGNHFVGILSHSCVHRQLIVVFRVQLIKNSLIPYHVGLLTLNNVKRKWQKIQMATDNHTPFLRFFEHYFWYRPTG